MKPATPLPWKVSGLGYLSDGKKVLARTESAPTQYQQRIDLCMEDAAYIAHAANAYPRLVEALRQMVGAMHQMDKGHHGDVLAAAALLRELGELE